MLRSKKPFALVLSILTAALSTSRAANFYQGVSPATPYWPGGIVPYVFTTNVSPAEQAVYLAGMREWGLSANIQFVPWTTQTNHVILDFDYLQGTNTYFGSVPPVMTIDNLSRGQICHETGHLLGFQHEHVRIDRDSYIIVYTNNIDTGSSTNASGEGSGGGILGLYEIDSNSTPYGAYDFESVMHYGRTLFSINPTNLDVLVPQPPYYNEYYNRIGNAALSVGDRAAAVHLYGAATIPLTNIVTNTLDFGPGSLRAAMYYANDHPGSTVKFNILTNDPGYTNGVYTIYVSGQLPAIVANGTIIDATTQAGYAGAPVIAVDGSKLIPQTEFNIGGIYIYSSNCILRGLALDNFTNSGVNLLYNYCGSNQVQGCYIGLTPHNAAAPNDFEGINIGNGAHDNTIGGATAAQRNVISGNAGYAITMIGTNVWGNVVSGNYIGLNGSGTAALSNTFNGIGIWGGSSSNTIGGAAAGAGNVISGNIDYGLLITDSGTTANVVQGNFIGVNAADNAAVSNSWTGLAIFNGSSNNVVVSNVISGNGNYGIYLSDPGTSGNVVQGNYVGTDAKGTTALPNSFFGVAIYNGAANNLIGGTTASQRNLISGNANDGLGTGGPLGPGNTIEGNYIGTTSNGLAALANNGVGLYVEFGLQSNLIISNVISGNSAGGITFYEGTNSIVAGNDIGVGEDGATPVPNNGVGFYLYLSQSNIISNNVVSANLNDGIQLYGAGTSYNTVEGNLVGTKKNGTSRLGNSFSAVSMLYGPTFNTVGGTTAAERNVLSASSNYDGIYLAGASNNIVEGNYIGTDDTGLTALPNNETGLVLNGASADNLVSGNVISGNANYGVLISDPGTTGNLIQGNNIGVGENGSTSVPNAWEGVAIQNGASQNSIGWTLESSGVGNIIADNGDEGVVVYNTNTVGNTLRGNSIFGNGRIGINLSGGTENGFLVTANHSGGAVPGPNDLQNYPVLTRAAVFTNDMVVAGTINAAASHDILIDIYSNSTEDPSGHGQGKTYYGTVLAETDASGNASFSLPSANRTSGQYFTTTATDATTGDTSEFSQDLISTNVTGTGPGQLTQVAYSATNGLSFSITLATNQNYTIQLATNFSTNPIAWTDLTNFFATKATNQIIDKSATNFPQRYYRAVTP
jgi:titin